MGCQITTKEMLFIIGVVRNKIDIVCLQETNSTEKVELKWERECGANSIWNHGLNNSRGVAILFSEKFNYDISDITRDIPGRKISCKINVSGHHGLNLVNVYLPNSGQERKNFICNNINIDGQKLNCVAGDFNCTLLKHLDRNPISIRDDVGTHEFREFIEKYDLLDIWKARNLNNKRHTFQRGNSQSRMDFIFITDEYNYLTQNKKKKIPFSDHDEYPCH
jgi:exonuclease III